MRTRGIVAVPVLLTLLLGGAVGCGDDTTTIKTKDGSAEISRDGDKVTIKGEDGSEFSAGQGELPADFPEQVPVPDGEIVSSAKVNAAGEGTGWYLQIHGSQEFSACYSDAADALLGAGFAEDMRSQAGETVSGSYTSATHLVVLLAVAGQEGCEVTMTVTPAES